MSHRAQAAISDRETTQHGPARPGPAAPRSLQCAVLPGTSCSYCGPPRWLARIGICARSSRRAPPRTPACGGELSMPTLRYGRRPRTGFAAASGHATEARESRRAGQDRPRLGEGLLPAEQELAQGCRDSAVLDRPALVVPLHGRAAQQPAQRL
jgi:hypothetical protein